MLRPDADNSLDMSEVFDENCSPERRQDWAKVLAEDPARYAKLKEHLLTIRLLSCYQDDDAIPLAERIALLRQGGGTAVDPQQIRHRHSLRCCAIGSWSVVLVLMVGGITFGGIAMWSNDKADDREQDKHPALLRR